MGITTATVSSIVNTGIAYGAQEARKDAIARENIPQINQNAQSKGTNSYSQSQSQLSPQTSALYLQSDAINRVNTEKENQKKEARIRREEDDDSSTDDEEGSMEVSSAGESKAPAAASFNSAQGASLDKEFTQAGALHQSASALIQNEAQNKGASFSEFIDDKRESGSGYSSRVIADTYNSIGPNNRIGRFLNVRS